jgi:hypothetical protein
MKKPWYVFPRLLYSLVVIVFVTCLFSCNDDDEAPVPEVTAINPSSAMPNTLISITGKAFSTVFSENKVTFNGKDALVSNASSTQLNVVVPLGAETGPVKVTVNGRAAANEPVFTVESLPTIISNVSPLSGKYNTVVTITGSNFHATPGNNTVTFNGISGIVESVTTTSLTVKVPLRAGSGPILVNGVTSGSIFTYIPDVYIIGHMADNTGTSRATFWKNGVPTTLSTTGLHSYAFDMAFVGDDMYVTGQRYVTSHSVARLWKNGTEIPLTDDARTSYAKSICVSGTDVYIAGYEGTATNTTRALYWKNGTPVYLTDGAKSASANGITVVGEDVFAGGNSIYSNGNTVATYWKNGTATQLTTGVSFSWDLFVSDNNVYSTGSIRNTGPGVGFVSYWKNEASVLLGPGLGGGAGRGIVVSGDDVYVAGVEDNSKGRRLAKYWKNGSPVFLSDETSYEIANAIDVIGDDVYVAGVSFDASGLAIVKLWKNGIPFSITDGSYYAYADGLVLR